jgi:hypothetical protein
MISAFRPSGTFGRARRAFVIAVVTDVVLGLCAATVYSAAPHSATAKISDGLGAPSEALTNLVAAGHGGLQPLFAMLLTVAFSWVAVWIGLSLPCWWHDRQ